MAEAFNTSVEQLEVELKKLILDGQMAARIDSHAQVHPSIWIPSRDVFLTSEGVVYTVHMCVPV